MKKIIKMLAVMAVFLAVVSCGKKQDTLYVYNWGDYINPELVEQFEKNFNCKVMMDFFDSNEAMYAKVQSGAVGYDLVVSSSYMAKIMNSQGMVLKLDKSKIPNLKNIDKNFLKLVIDKEMNYSVPYLTSYSGIAYLKSKVKNVENSWKMFDRPELKGRTTLLNDVRETFGMSLKALGYSLNTINDSEIKAAKEQLIKWKKNIAKFEVDEAKRGLAIGEFYMIHTYNGDALQIIKENSDVAFFVPKEGTCISSDDFIILANSKNSDLAHKFINYMLDPKVSSENMKFVTFLAPNAEAQKLMGDEYMKNPAVSLSPEILQKCELIDDLGENNEKYNKAWDEIKAAE